MTNYQRAASVAQVVSEIALVTRLDGGLGRTFTYGPGARVAGVKVADQHVTIRACITYGTTISEADTAIRAAVAPLVEGRRLDIQIADIDTVEDVERAASEVTQ